MLVPRSRQRESKLVPHHNGCLSLPLWGGTIIRGSIDLSAAGPRAALLPPITNSTYPFAIFQSEKSTLFFYESLRIYSRSLVGYFHGYFIVARRARSGGRGIILSAANRKGRIEEEDEREREAVGRKLARRFHFLSICIYEPAWSWKLLSAWKVDARHFDISTASRARFAGFPRRGRVSMEKRKRWWRIFWLLEAKERKWCLWRDVFVKDSLTRSSLPEYYFTWRGFTNLGQRRPPSSSSSFVRLDYATTLFPCLSFLAFLFFPFPFPLSFLSLSRNSPHSYHSFCVPVEIGRRLADGDFRARVSRIPREICASLGWKNDPTNKRRRRNTIHNRCRFVSFSLYCKNENWPSVSSPRYRNEYIYIYPPSSSLPYLISV